jgi:protein-S-isoprenylcysteine O-methyltransferase Ste14
LFIAYWTASGLSTKRAVERKSLLSSLAYRIPIVAGVLLMIWNKPSPLLLALWDASAAGYAGAAICVLGLLGAIWARVSLGGNWSSDVTIKESHVLVERGPYRFARHPIYTTMLMMFLGAAIARGRLCAWLGLGALFVGFWIKLGQEEVFMTRHFPDAYPAYKARVKALIPFVF